MAQDDLLTATDTRSYELVSTVTGPDAPPTGSEFTYASLSRTSTLNTAAATSSAETASFSSTSGVESTSTEDTATNLVGSQPVSTALNGTASLSVPSTSTSSAPAATNTQPCNGHPELCSRKYSNITEVCAHNSPFVQRNNFASNQAYPVVNQLTDGVRMLQMQTHHNATTNTLHLCHTSCEILDAGLLQDYLRTVVDWLNGNPYEVITILLGNSDVVDVTEYVAPIRDSGLIDFLYTPPSIPMDIDGWPTLAEMILSGRRVVLFLDYEARQNEVPYILDEFSYMWETPFSPTNNSFPCSEDRPPGLDPNVARQRMYIANHNLNAQISFLGTDLLIPDTVSLPRTNAADGNGSLGAMAQECQNTWGRAPNFLLLDYYNVGGGSVFQVAAEHNGLSYNRECCGETVSGASCLFKGFFTMLWPYMMIGVMLVLSR
ncbi:PLC-like phosphodiesterase [Aulographum hederae CBS 113979]|uniref:PLC-like phosphodiesterase n=1 Tax=Aulographum hederae CBS 113979 TaxID=1176131 RepID=A0A6G1H418_9PEZI|nr:PLC-like phosphodiesterase [Aulographum hederae CBS 113979]